MIHPDNTPSSVAQVLADPLRFEILVRLLEGPDTVAGLVALTGATQPNVSNHLGLLRRQGLIRGTRRGRQVEYRSTGPAVAQAVEALSTLATTEVSGPRPPAPLALGRRCYDHLAGRLGVSALDSLIELKALSPPEEADGTIRLAANAEPIFKRLGVDVEAAMAGRRRFAYACMDWTERRGHLGGGLGAALYRRFLERGWIVPASDSRAVLLTDAGRRPLREIMRIPARRLG
jgi:DNA-binding transcriptional ArsR family regulator